MLILCDRIGMILLQAVLREDDHKEMKSRTRQEKFDWNYFIRHIAIIAVPVALQNLLTTTGSMVDTMMLASLGEQTVGAVGLCAQFSSLMFAGYWGFVGGGMLFLPNIGGQK